MAANWNTLSIELPGKDLLEPVRGALEALAILLDILKVILDTIKAFLIDFGNPIRILVETLIGLIEELFLSLTTTGLFAYFDVPNTVEDPNFNRHVGGIEAFKERFKASLFDTRDFNRPQPRPGSSKGGYVLIAIDTGTPFDLVSAIRQLLEFFGRGYEMPRYEAPANLKVLPVGASGDPILRLAAYSANAPVKSMQIQWTLPTSVESPEPGFGDVVMKLASELVPPGFVIEKSVDVNPAARKIQLSEMSAADATGIVEYDRPAKVDQSLASRFAQKDGSTITRKALLLDDQGEPVIKFQKYIVVDTPTQILGQLGRFRYIDDDVEPGHTYYYRVRAFTGGTLNVSNNELVGAADSYSKLATGFGANSDARLFKWPSKKESDVITMGRPSGLIAASMPVDVGDFDAFEVAKALFKTGFILDFHMPKGPEDQFDPVSGLPINTTSPVAVGRGSLTDQAGNMASVQHLPVIGTIANSESITETALSLGKAPWDTFNIRRASARLTNIVVPALFQDPQSFLLFRDLMRNPFPKGAIAGDHNLAKAKNIEEAVLILTKSELAADLIPIDPGDTVDPVDYLTYEAAYQDVSLRLNVLEAIRYLRAFLLSGGTKPDWISVVPLRDIIPWSAQFLYDLLDKIQALLDAFNGVIDEIRAFIELLERKITALEQFIQFLIDILDFVLGLKFSASILVVPEVEGAVSNWITALDGAEDGPEANPDNYTAGIALAYVAPDISAFKTAFSIIFGA